MMAFSNSLDRSGKLANCSLAFGRPGWVHRITIESPPPKWSSRELPLPVCLFNELNLGAIRRELRELLGLEVGVLTPRALYLGHISNVIQELA